MTRSPRTIAPAKNDRTRERRSRRRRTIAPAKNDYAGEERSLPRPSSKRIEKLSGRERGHAKRGVNQRMRSQSTSGGEPWLPSPEPHGLSSSPLRAREPAAVNPRTAGYLYCQQRCRYQTWALTRSTTDPRGALGEAAPARQRSWPLLRPHRAADRRRGATSSANYKNTGSLDALVILARYQTRGEGSGVAARLRQPLNRTMVKLPGKGKRNLCVRLECDRVGNRNKTCAPARGPLSARSSSASPEPTFRPSSAPGTSVSTVPLAAR